MDKYKSKSKRIVIFFIMIFMLSGFVSNNNLSAKRRINPPKDLVTMNNVFKQIADKVMPAIVFIKVTRVASRRRMHPLHRFFFRGQPRRRRSRRVKGVGSGVIINSQGYIVTNYHVIRQAQGLSVLLTNNKEYKVKVVGVDKETDIAVLKMIGNVKGITPVTMGNSDKVKPGEIVFALGNPFGLRGSITQGIVSAVSRKTQRSYGYDFIQTDAAINPGNSGGALVNIYGQLIGINRMIYTRTGGYMGIGFAIPVNRVKEVVKMIIKHGKVTRGYLGIIPANPDSETSRKMNLKAGVKIAEVIPDSPAEKAGLKPWDVIIRVNGKRIKSFSTLKRIISLKRPGSRIRIRVKRQNKIRRFTVRLADRSKALDSEINEGLNRGRGERNSGNALSMYGMTLKNLSPAQKRSVRVRYGVVVTNVKPNSPAMNSGLRPGDVILEIESLKMTSISRAKSILRSVQRKKAFQIRIKRNNRIRFIVIEK